MRYVFKTVDVEIDVLDILEEVDDELIRDEYERRELNKDSGWDNEDINGLIEKIYYAKSKNEPYEAMVDKLIYETIGRII